MRLSALRTMLIIHTWKGLLLIMHRNEVTCRNHGKSVGIFLPWYTNFKFTEMHDDQMSGLHYRPPFLANGLEQAPFEGALHVVGVGQVRKHFVWI